MSVRWMTIQEILEDTEDSCDFYHISGYDTPEGFWFEMIRVKSSDTGFGHLVESIMEKGFIEEGAIGWKDGRITEGHHRLVAAILLCLDKVPVTDYGGRVAAADRYHLISAHLNLEDPYPIPVD